MADGALRVDDDCWIDAGEIAWRFGPSGGPGGQHANRSNTRAEATFDIEASPSLTEAQRTRLLAKLGPVVHVSVDDERSQARNRAAAVDRLVAKLAAALVRPKPRKKTRPSRASTERRLDAKKRRSDTKRGRARPGSPDD